MFAPSFSMTRRAAGLCGILALAACSGTHTHVLGLHRDGPPFDEAFPDPAVLVTTDDPEGVRAELATVQLPANGAHTDRLFDLLRARESISAPHLVLLVEAVRLPERGVWFVGSDTGWRVYAARGDGDYARVVDGLLHEGAGKLVDVDRRWLGELIARTQSDATMVELADRFLPALDDGSADALLEIVRGTSGSPALRPFVADYLAPRGRLDDPRAFALLDLLPFDDDRVALLEVLAARPTPADGERLVAVVEAMSFDEGRARAVALMAPRAAPVSMATAVTALAAFSFDDGRVEGLRALAGHLDDGCDGTAARTLLSGFSFDSGRLAATRALAPRWSALPAADKQALLATFAFDSDRRDAEALLR